MRSGLLVTLLAGVLLPWAVGGCQGGGTNGGRPGFQEFTVKVTASYPHDVKAFTQGLLFFENRLYESTGKYGKSSLRRVVPKTGTVEKKRRLESLYFAEGLAIIGRTIYQLTYKRGTCLKWNVDTFEPEGVFRYEGEGWGLTHDGTHLIMSNGSAELTFRDPATFEAVRTIEVTHEGEAQGELNELEFIRGQIFANVWKKETILRIDPADGTVTGIIDASGLRPQLIKKPGFEGVLNGIAHDEERDILYLTGKLWDRVFEVTLVPK